MDIGWRRFRASAGPILSLGVLGTFATAGLVAVFAHYALGFDWTLAGLIGAALAPTDPAVMFSVLGRREIAGRSGTMLEGEAGVNDPAGIALMLGLIELATHEDASFVVVREFVVEMGIGLALGVLGARAAPAAAAASALPAEGSIRCSRSPSRASSTAPRRSHTARASSPSSSPGSCSATRAALQGRDRALPQVACNPRRDRRFRRARPDHRPRLAQRRRLGRRRARCSCSPWSRVRSWSR